MFFNNQNEFQIYNKMRHLGDFEVSFAKKSQVSPGHLLFTSLVSVPRHQIDPGVDQ